MLAPSTYFNMEEIKMAKFHKRESHEFGNYNFCRDYALLKQLVDEGKRVITFRPFDGLAVFYKTGEYGYRFFNNDTMSSTGDAWDLTPWDEWWVKNYGPQPTFEGLCTEQGVEFLIPNE